jgi:hypothetical protein
MRDANDRALWIGDDVIHVGAGETFTGTVVRDLGDGRCHVRVQPTASESATDSDHSLLPSWTRRVSCCDLMRMLSRPVPL